MTTGDLICPYCKQYISSSIDPSTGLHVCYYEKTGEAANSREVNSHLTFEKLRLVNFSRTKQDFGQQSLQKWTPEQWACAIAGEVGEMCNMIKKKYSRQGMALQKDIPIKEIALELADIVTYCDLLASRFGFNLEDLIIEKFNKVSDRLGSNKRL